MRHKMPEKDRESIKNLIIDAAQAIIEQEGIHAVSIRKVAKCVGYTPGSIYQYFDDKESLLQAVITKGYQSIMTAIKKPFLCDQPIEPQIRSRFLAYVKAALRMPDYYQAVMLSQHPLIIKNTAVFDSDLSKSQPAIQSLIAMLACGVKQKEFIPCDTVDTAKALWAAIFGLTMRLIVEKINDEATVKRLVDTQCIIILNGLKGQST